MKVRPGGYTRLAAITCLVLVIAAVFGPSTSATAVLAASKTATASSTRTFTWTIDKSVTPASHDLQTGQSGTSTYTVAVTKSAPVDSAVTVSGSVCITNNGSSATANLTIMDRIIAMRASGPNVVVQAFTAIDTSANPVLDPGESHCYPYSFQITQVANATGYRNDADITITNRPGAGGAPAGPRVSAPFTIPAPTLVNNSINVDDTNGMSWPFSASGSVTYTKTFTCDEDAGSHSNTATIRETGQSDNATVTVTCTPPGNEGCTPGYWKNHPESFAGTGVTPSSTLASVGFNVGSALTFDQALTEGGGELDALLRHAAAAYLNAMHADVDYPLTAAQIVTATNAAIASGDYEATKDAFDEYNNLNAPGFCE